MTSRNKSLFSAPVLAAAFVMLFTATMLLQADDDDAEETQDTTSIVSATSVAVSAELDAVFTEINRGYLTLEPIFKRSCFDCHSDKTNYPWYYKLPIVKGMIDHDIKEARENLDVTNGFPFEGNGGPADRLKDIKEEVAEGAMPLWNYRLMHWNAALSQSEKDSVSAWGDRSMKKLAEHGVVPKPKGEQRKEKEEGE